MAGTRWARIDTGYLRNPKVAELSTSGAVLLHLASILYCAEQLTDGVISPSALRTLIVDARLRGGFMARSSAIEELCDAHLWLPNGTGWRVHDYEAMQPQAMRDASNARGSMARASAASGQRSEAGRHVRRESGTGRHA